MFFKSQYKGHTSFLIILTLPFKKKKNVPVFPPKTDFHHFNSYSANTLTEMFDSICQGKFISILYVDELGYAYLVY